MAAAVVAVEASMSTPAHPVASTDVSALLAFAPEKLTLELASPPLNTMEVASDPEMLTSYQR